MGKKKAVRHGKKPVTALRVRKMGNKKSVRRGKKPESSESDLDSLRPLNNNPNYVGPTESEFGSDEETAITSSLMEFGVQDIVDSRIRNKRQQYKAKWKDSWLDEDDLNCPKTLARYKRRESTSKGVCRCCKLEMERNVSRDNEEVEAESNSSNPPAAIPVINIADEAEPHGSEDGSSADGLAGRDGNLTNLSPVDLTYGNLNHSCPNWREGISPPSNLGQADLTCASLGHESPNLSEGVSNRSNLGLSGRNANLGYVSPNLSEGVSNRSNLGLSGRNANLGYESPNLSEGVSIRSNLGLSGRNANRGYESPNLSEGVSHRSNLGLSGRNANLGYESPNLSEGVSHRSNLGFSDPFVRNWQQGRRTYPESVCSGQSIFSERSACTSLYTSMSGTAWTLPRMGSTSYEPVVPSHCQFRIKSSAQSKTVLDKHDYEFTCKLPWCKQKYSRGHDGVKGLHWFPSYPAYKKRHVKKHHREKSRGNGIDPNLSD